MPKFEGMKEITLQCIFTSGVYIFLGWLITMKNIGTTHFKPRNTYVF